MGNCIVLVPLCLSIQVSLLNRSLPSCLRVAFIHWTLQIFEQLLRRHRGTQAGTSKLAWPGFHYWANSYGQFFNLCPRQTHLKFLCNFSEVLRESSRQLHQGVRGCCKCPSHPAAPCCKCFLCLNSAKKLHGNLKWLLSVLRARRSCGLPPGGPHLLRHSCYDFFHFYPGYSLPL